MGNTSSYKTEGNEIEDQGNLWSQFFIAQEHHELLQEFRGAFMKPSSKERIWLRARFCCFLKRDFFLVALYNPAKVQPSTIKHAVISKCLSLSYSFAMEISSDSISVSQEPAL